MRRRAEAQAVMFQGIWLHLRRGHSTAAVRQTCPFQLFLGCGRLGMWSVFVYTHFSFVFLLSSCRMSGNVPDFLPGGNGMGKEIAAPIYIAFLLVTLRMPESVLHLSHLISLILLTIRL